MGLTYEHFVHVSSNIYPPSWRSGITLERSFESFRTSPNRRTSEQFKASCSSWVSSIIYNLLLCSIWRITVAGWVGLEHTQRCCLETLGVYWKHFCQWESAVAEKCRSGWKGRTGVQPSENFPHTKTNSVHLFCFVALFLCPWVRMLLLLKS